MLEEQLWDMHYQQLLWDFVTWLNAKILIYNNNSNNNNNNTHIYNDMANVCKITLLYIQMFNAVNCIPLLYITSDKTLQ